MTSPVKGGAPRPPVIQPARSVVGGFFGGAAVGFAVGGPAGAIGGGLGGAILGPVVNWWYNLPQPRPFVPGVADLDAGRQNLRQTPGPAPHVPPQNRAEQMLRAGRQNLRQAPLPGPYIPPPSQADQMLTTGRLNLRPTPAPTPYVPPINPGALAAARQSLIQRPALAPYVPPPNPADQILGARRLGLTVLSRAPQVVPLAEQTFGKTLAQLIRLPSVPGRGTVILYKLGHKTCSPLTVLAPGVHVIFYRVCADGLMGDVLQTTLHIKPSIFEFMDAMGFVLKNWRWDLPWGFHGTLNKYFHLSVPHASQHLPVRMDDLDAILEGLFPAGNGLVGTHMSIECGKPGVTNNAAYFLNGTPKYPQGYTPNEQEAFVKACKTRMADWKSARKRLLRDALADMPARFLHD